MLTRIASTQCGLSPVSEKDTWPFVDIMDGRRGFLERVYLVEMEGSVSGRAPFVLRFDLSQFSGGFGTSATSRRGKVWKLKTLTCLAMMAAQEHLLPSAEEEEEEEEEGDEEEDGEEEE